MLETSNLFFTYETELALERLDKVLSTLLSSKLLILRKGKYFITGEF